MMKIALASDHAGYAEKERLKPLLNELGIGRSGSWDSFRRLG